MKKIRAILAILLSFSILFVALPMSVLAEEVVVEETTPAVDASGSDSGADWFYDASEKTVTVSSGSGVIPTQFASKFAAYDYDKIIVADGVTTLSKEAFLNSKAVEFHLPDSLLTVSEYAFKNSTRLEWLVIPHGVLTLGACVVIGCEALTQIYFPKSVTSSPSTLLYGNDKTKLTVYLWQNWSWSSHVVRNGSQVQGFTTMQADTAIYKADGSVVLGLYSEIATTAVSGDTIRPIIDISTSSIANIAEGVKWDLHGKNVGHSQACGSTTITRKVNLVTKTLSYEGTGVLSANATGDISAYDYEHLVIGEGITDITLQNAFSGNTKITTVKLPSTLKNICEKAFRGITNLKALHIPNGVETIGYGLTMGNSLEVLYLPYTLTSLNGNWYLDQTAKTKMVYYTEGGVAASGTLSGKCAAFQTVQCMVGDGLTTDTKYFKTYDDAFAAGYTAEQITSLTPAPSGTFEGPVSDSSYTTKPVLSWKIDPLTGTLTIAKVSGDDGDKCNMIGYSSDPSPRPWQAYATSVKKIVIESGVTSIGARIFQGMSKVTEVEIPNTVTNMGFAAFSGTALKEVVIPSSITTFGAQPFPSTVEKIEFSAVWPNAHQTLLDGLSTENTIVYVGNITDGSILRIAKSKGFKRWATTKGTSGDVEWFHGNGNLSIYGTGAMSDYTADELPAYVSKASSTLYIANGITHIGAYSFYGMADIAQVEIPESVTSIGENAFGGCTGLVIARIPATVTTIAEGAIPSNVVIIAESGTAAAEYAAANGNPITNALSGTLENNITWSYDINTGLLTIEGEGAIPDYSGETPAPWSTYSATVKSVKMSLGITAIGTNAFNGFTALNNVAMRATVTTISSGAFAGCTALAEIELLKSVSSIALDAFDKTTTISCYEGSYAETFADENGYTSVHPKTLKVLTIGNSYTMNAYQYIGDIVKSAGVENYTLGRLYYGGRRLEEHYAHAIAKPNVDDVDDYGYYEYTDEDPAWRTASNVSVAYGLKAQDWDIIIMQPYYSEPLTGNNANGQFDGMIEYINANKTNPYAELGWYFIWSRPGDVSENAANTLELYNQMSATIQSEIMTNENIKYIVPVGTSIQNLRNTYMTEYTTTFEGADYTEFMGDGTHMGLYGQFIAGLTFVKALIGLSIDAVTDPTYQISAADLALIKDGVNAAVANPFEVSVAKIGTEYYTSLSAAVEAANDGDVVTLIGNSAETVVYNKDITINGGSCELSGIVYADFNGDSEVDIRDLICLKQHMADSSSPIKTPNTDTEQPIDAAVLTVFRRTLLSTVALIK